MVFDRLRNALSARQALNVVDHTEPRLNRRGERVLAYLQLRQRRENARLDQEAA